MLPVLRTVVAVAIAAPSVAYAVDLTVGGACPGRMTLTVSDATPDADIALVSAAGFGASSLPGGVCAGTPLGIGPAGIALRGVVRADGVGTAMLTPGIRAPACGAVVQAIDLATCATSAPAPLDGLPVLIAADGRDGVAGAGLYAIDLVAGTVTPIAEMDRPLTGLSYASEGALWGLSTREDGFLTSAVTVDPGTGAQGVRWTDERWGGWSGLAWAGGVLYGWTETTDSLHVLDPVTGPEELPLLSGLSYNHCLAADADGRLFQLRDIELLEVDPLSGTVSLVGIPLGLPYGASGKGCAFHDGALLVGGSSSPLYRIDVDALTAEETGVVLPEGFDALASRTP
ncbi:MAG: hypothetical protein ACI8PZ_004522 [Myxococcota bacterium]|jgi:hypothetical protein